MAIGEDLERALVDLPLFPLHGAVLFPGALLPLHVFEPRYRAMMQAVIGGRRALAIAHVPDPRADMAGNPPIAEIAGAGTVVEHRELPGGRFHVVVRGRIRVRLQELSFAPPFRRAIATAVATKGDVPPMDVAAMHNAVTQFAALVRARDATFEFRSPKNEGGDAIAEAAAFADAAANQLVINSVERQRVLEALDLKTRVRVVTEVLTIQRTTLSPGNRVLN